MTGILIKFVKFDWDFLETKRAYIPLIASERGFTKNKLHIVTDVKERRQRKLSNPYIFRCSCIYRPKSDAVEKRESLMTQ